MPIAGISEVVRLPRLGKIRLGVKKEGAKGPYPAATDYFVCPPEVQQIYGEKPKQMDVMFPVEDEDIFAPQWLRCYSQSRGCVCWGDGRTANRLIDGATEDLPGGTSRKAVMQPIPCDPDSCLEYQSRRCRRLMNLQFLLPGVVGLGVWQLNTSSRNSILNINGAIHTIRAICGRVAMIPLNLSLEPQEVVPPGDTRKVVQVLQLRASLSLAAVQRLGTMEPTRVLLPAPELGADEDLYPSEVLEEEEATPLETIENDVFPPRLTEAEEREICWEDIREYMEKTQSTVEQMRLWFKRNGLSLSLTELSGEKPPQRATLDMLGRLRDNLRSYRAKTCSIAGIHATVNLKGIPS